ncbi:MAG: formyltetrahydrofolate deformylase [Terrimicrobiaceae bacterium]|nr:formyltetrahydrofolate deformylase [Terrimicrobiaceae bacterium]
MSEVQILKLDCPDAVGLLARITSAVAARGGNLLDASQFTDLSSGWFFVRLAIAPGDARWNLEGLRADLGVLADDLRAQWSLRPATRRLRTAIFVSRQDHCLADLLWRWRSGELPIEIPLVISNHEVCRGMVEREGPEFHRLDFAADKEGAFRQAFELLRARDIELAVLARFMQIVPGWMCREYAGRMINIHHSFLPAFVGANPYRRAFERGVKLIGATCHYVTEELDAGPIIEQEVARVEHYHDPDDLSRLGRDCERLALARGVRYHAEGRVLLHGTRSIVFRD